jgi:hypothetical protein
MKTVASRKRSARLARVPLNLVGRREEPLVGRTETRQHVFAELGEYDAAAGAAKEPLTALLLQLRHVERDGGFAETAQVRHAYKHQPSRVQNGWRIGGVMDVDFRA